MRPLRLCLALAAAQLAACNCGQGQPAGEQDGGPHCTVSCGDGQTCDPATNACAKALPEGQECGKGPDGGVVEGACTAGFSCGSVGGTQTRCSKDCTSDNAAQVCGTLRKCFARPGSTTAAGYCGTAAAEGAACDDSLLVKCSGENLTCVSPSGDTSGQCFRYCDPSVPDPNPECTAAGSSCADLFPSDPTKGLCVKPAGRYPLQCDYNKLVFCARGETCVRPTDDTWGYCHQKCAKPQDCTTAGETCAQPSTGLNICAAPVARCTGADPTKCAVCSAEKDQYCGPGDLCVRIDPSTVCKQDCTGGLACAEGLCTPLPGDRSACL